MKAVRRIERIGSGSTDSVVTLALMVLTKAQRNELYEILEEQDWNPREFKLTPRGEAVEITHAASGSWWGCEDASPYLYPKFQAGDGPVEKWGMVEEWEEVAGTFHVWLSRIKEERELPDLWGEVERERELMSAAADEGVENRPFTAEELGEIPGLLGQVRDHFTENYELDDHQRGLLEVRLSYLEEAAGRMNRFDWRNALLGAVFGLMLEAVVPPEAVRNLMPVLAESIGRLFGIEIPQLPPVV